MNTLKISGMLGAAMLLQLSAYGQEPNPTQQSVPAQQPQQYGDPNVPLYRIQVVARDIPAINYFHRSGSTKIGFQGTGLMPAAKGEGKVEARNGRTAVALELDGLTPANGFGPEYLTYVLWAISPEGRPVNLGEILPTGGHDKVDINVTTNLQAFGMIITAEPYFAVTVPSDIVIMQNVVEDRTTGVIENVNAHYSLLPRGAYAETAGRHSVLHPITRHERSPLELYEAENAVQIAAAAGAEKYATDTMQVAKTAMLNAEQIDEHGRDRKQTITYAREAVQSAEDARLITIRKIRAEDEENARQGRLQAEESTRQAQASEQREATQRAQAEAAAEEAKARAESARAAREQAEAQAAQSAAQAQAAQQQAQAAQQQAEQARQQTVQMRERLRQQLSQVLQTRETARGLIVNMSDVLFDFNKYTLKPDAREKLAKVSGILAAYPDLKVQVEGYTDNIGSDEYNQKLSEQRANAVSAYLTTEGVHDGNISAQGFGKAHPIADNSTNSGRAQNRRVEMVVSGQSIGIGQESGPSAGENAPAQPGAAPAEAGTAPAQPGTIAAQPQYPTGTSAPPQQ